MASNKGMVIRGGDVLMPDGRIRTRNVVIRDGLISSVGTQTADGKVLDASDCLVLPGLIDLHTHGVGPFSAGDSGLSDIAAFEASRGCTTFIATLFAPPDELLDQMSRHLRETNRLRLTPNAYGFRLESPYLARTGGGSSQDLAPIDYSLTQRLLRAAGGLLRIWDISPELEGAADLIECLSQAGVVCSIAHTQASIDQARKAVDAGAALVTHLFDTFVLPEMTEPGAYPAGLVDYLLIEDRLFCEIIADGLHVHPILVEKVLRCKSYDRIAFVTDSNRGAGLPPGRHVLGEWGEAVVGTSNEGIRLVERDMVLAGSALTPIDVFHNAVSLFGCDIARASALCSRTPAKVMRLNKGEVSPGKDADLIVVSRELQVLYTICGGNTIYSA